MALDTRHRERSGEISRKHGNTLIRTLRKTYGESFAPGCADSAKLSDVLSKLDDTSLGHLFAITKKDTSKKSVAPQSGFGKSSHNGPRGKKQRTPQPNP